MKRAAFFNAAFEGLLKIQHDRLGMIVHVLFGVHAQESDLFLDMKRQMHGLAVDKVAVEERFCQVDVGFFDVGTFSRVEAVIESDLADLVEVLMLDKFR